jgi:hypothetical protein
MNEFKISTLRQFGSENLSFTSVIHSDKQVLSPEELKGQIKQIGDAINLAFVATQEREISEKALLAGASERRRAEVDKLDNSLKAEMKAKEDAGRTMKEAERLSKKLSK